MVMDFVFQCSIPRHIQTGRISYILYVVTFSAVSGPISSVIERATVWVRDQARAYPTFLIALGSIGNKARFKIKRKKKASYPGSGFTATKPVSYPPVRPAVQGKSDVSFYFYFILKTHYVTAMCRMHVIFFLNGNPYEGLWYAARMPGRILVRAS